MNIGPARLSNHASALREDQINREAKLVASAETAKIMARVSSSSKDFAEEKQRGRLRVARVRHQATASQTTAREALA